jgi:hypothetical protein
MYGAADAFLLADHELLSQWDIKLYGVWSFRGE